MNKSTFKNLALAVCMSLISAPLLAEVTPAPEHPANITAPATAVTEHQEVLAKHHEALAKEHKNKAKAYEKMGK